MSSITINANLPALCAGRRLDQSTSCLQHSLVRLSSGLRINKASDDAAGLAISSSLNTDGRVFNQGIRNLNEGISVLNIADGALENLSSIVIRLQELSEQAANGTLALKQRKALDDEAQNLAGEYLRISRATAFNGVYLLREDCGVLNLQAGYGSQGSIDGTLGGTIGDGSLSPPQSYAAEGTATYGCALGDVDGDGVLDMVTTGDSGPGEATVFLGAGDGTFSELASYTTDSQLSYEVRLGDINCDGVLDMVTAGDSGPGTATVFLGLGSGAFSKIASYTTESSSSNGLYLADLNSDNFLDMVTCGIEGTAGAATVFLGRGNGLFSKKAQYSTEGSMSSAVRLRDINGDRIVDMVTTGTGMSSGEATVFLGLGDGTFAKIASYAASSDSSHDLSLGDVNGDGLADLVTSGKTDFWEGEAIVFLGQGNGTFSKAAAYTTSSATTRAVVLSDLNGDGALDMALAANNAQGDVSVWSGRGNGSFSKLGDYNAFTSTIFALDAGDINGDGVPDIAAAGTNIGVGRAAALASHTKSGTAALLEFSLQTQADARQAMPVFRRKLEQLAAQRGQIGAMQVRLGTAVSTLRVLTENYAAAESQIKDADIAEESANALKNRVLQQAGAAVLSQAHRAPELALMLLQPD